MSDSFGARFLAAKAARDNVSNYALSKMTGIPDNLLGKYEKGTMPNAAYALALADALGVSLEWLVGGRGEMTSSSVGAEQLVAPAMSADFALIPRLSVEASAGAGAINHAEEIVQLLAFRTEWLHRLGVSPATARALSVRGDSMAPTLQHGDLVLVDTAVERVEDAGIYVVGIDDRVLVKRILRKFDGSLALISENPVYSPEEIPAGATDKLRVLGRVRWYGRAI